MTATTIDDAVRVLLVHSGNSYRRDVPVCSE